MAGHEAEVYYHLGLRLSTSEVSGFHLRYLKNLRPGVSYANLGKHVLAAASVNDSDDSDIPQRHTSRELRNIFRFPLCEAVASQTFYCTKPLRYSGPHQAVPAYDQAINLTREDKPHYLHERRGLKLSPHQRLWRYGLCITHATGDW